MVLGGMANYLKRIYSLGYVVLERRVAEKTLPFKSLFLGDEKSGDFIDCMSGEFHRSVRNVRPHRCV